MLELFDCNVPKENWCIPKFNNIVKSDNGIEYEFGIYKEEDGSLTLQVFANDDIVICNTIIE